MTEENLYFLEKIRFLARNNSTLSEICEMAKEMAAQNLPVFVTGPDTAFRKWFSELLSFCRNKTLGLLECWKAENIQDIQKIQTVEKNSVLFLDGIEKLSLDFQDEIVGLIENHFFESRNVLLIAGSKAGSSELESLVVKGVFSARLNLHLNFVKADIPALTEIKGGAETFAWSFFQDAKKDSGKEVKSFISTAIKALAEYPYSSKDGLFQLKSFVYYAVSVCETEFVSDGNLPFVSNSVKTDKNQVYAEITRMMSASKADVSSASGSGLNNGNRNIQDNQSEQEIDFAEDKTMKTALDSFKRYYVKKILEENGNNQTKAAEVLGLQRTYVSRLISELNIR